jgi:hypothetical protein
MLLKRPVKFRKPRARMKPSDVSLAPPPAALSVIGVENVFYDEPLLTFTLVFNTTEDAPLVAGELDAGKWSAVYQGGGFFCESAAVGGFDRIDVTMNGTPGAGGASSVSYANDPSDVSDSLGRQLAAFEGFPL